MKRKYHPVSYTHLDVYKRQGHHRAYLRGNDTLSIGKITGEQMNKLDGYMKDFAPNFQLMQVYGKNIYDGSQPRKWPVLHVFYRFSEGV